jgi:hypothetical protein
MIAFQCLNSLCSLCLLEVANLESTLGPIEKRMVIKLLFILTSLACAGSNLIKRPFLHIYFIESWKERRSVKEESR